MRKIIYEIVLTIVDAVVLIGLVLFIAWLVAGCKPVEYTVKNFYPSTGGQWIIEASSKKGNRNFITDCRPDSVGVRFKN